MPRTTHVTRFLPSLQTLEQRLVPAEVALPVSLRRTAQVALIRNDLPTPLGEFAPGQTYQGLLGGFYDQGSNTPPMDLAAKAEAAASRIRPLDLRGRDAESGRIGVVAIGQSTTEQWFSTFLMRARIGRGEIRPGVFFINGGQSGQVASSWAYSNTPWAGLSRRLGMSTAQVQVAYIDVALIYGQRLGGPTHQAEAYADQVGAIIARAQRLFPNLQLVYVFPFHWGGTASEHRAVSEPGNYEMQFGVRRLILEQNHSTPALVWGPDVWAATQDPALYSDGLHWTMIGRSVMTDLTWRFLQNDPLARQWLWR